MATIGVSDEHYANLKKLSKETGQPIRSLADQLIGLALKKMVLKEVTVTSKELVME